MRLSVARALRAGIAAALLSAGLGVATAQPAAAACGFSFYPSANGDGSGIAKASANGWNLKAAYYSDCANVSKIYGGERLWFHCYVVNSYGNLWWYGRVAGTSRTGWISADNLVEQPTTDDNGDGRVDQFACL